MYMSMSAALGLVAPLIELAEVISSQKGGAIMTEILSLVTAGASGGH